MLKTVVPLDDVNMVLDVLGLHPVSEDDAAKNTDAIQRVLDHYADLVERCQDCGGLTRSAPGFSGPYCKHVGIA